MTDKVALSIIVGDGQDENTWAELLESVRDAVDVIFVSYNGKENFFPYAAPDNLIWEHHKWEDDFAKARNNAFAMIPKDEFDWIFWLDSDDTLVHPEKFRPMLERANREGLHQIFLTYIYASDPEDGTPRVTQQRERVLSTKVPWKWHFSIHECVYTRPGAKVANYTDCFVLHHREIDPFSHKETRDRNRRILAAARAESPDEPRYVYYQANEFFAEAFFLYEQGDNGCVEFFKKAIQAYKDYGMTDPASDDAYIANYRIGDALRMLAQWPRAIDTAMQGIKIRPRWPESWALSAHCRLGMEEYESCEETCDIMLEICREPQTNQVSEPLTLYYTPYALRALARTQLGKYDEAEQDYLTALKFWDNPKLRERMDDNAKRRDNTTGKKADGTRDRFFDTKRNRSIAFLSRPLPEVWNAETLKAGSGGAEWCVHEIARRFKADGHRVCIFGTPGDERGVDSEGIEWWNTADYKMNEEFTHVVSIRAPEVFDTPLKVRKSKILWLHDINMGGMEVANSPWGNRFDTPDHIIALTDFHSKRIQRTYMTDPKKMTVIGNGINLEDYPTWDETKRVNNKFIYASSPDRGIDTLLMMWPDIKEVIPDAQLHVYYGWNMLDKIVALSGGNHPLANYKAGVVAMYEAVKHLDVEWHNRIARSDLQRVETTCDKWLYPTHFLETYCITALEMQMNGVIPLVNGVGALPETVGSPDYFVTGMPNHPDYQKRYIEKLAKLTGDISVEEREGNAKFASQFTWDHRYDQWRQMLDIKEKNERSRIVGDVRSPVVVQGESS